MPIKIETFEISAHFFMKNFSTLRTVVEITQHPVVRFHLQSKWNSFFSTLKVKSADTGGEVYLYH